MAISVKISNAQTSHPTINFWVFTLHIIREEKDYLYREIFLSYIVTKDSKHLNVHQWTVLPQPTMEQYTRIYIYEALYALARTKSKKRHTIIWKKLDEKNVPNSLHSMLPSV